MRKIVDWSEISDDFREGLILGNGASIALHHGFAYQSLLQEARRRKFISQEIERIFDHLHTRDFERVLRMLWHASRINKALRINEAKTRKSYKSLRTALVKTVTEIHPVHSQVSDQLPQITKFMMRFKIVLSLNYDLLVYWAMIRGNKRHPNRFKDCFIHGVFDSAWMNYCQPYGSAKDSTLVFYPHGNLALATDLSGREKKLTPSAFSNLLETVITKWESGKYSPIFVSEGTSKQKCSAINRSFYLKTIHDSVLPKLGTHVVVFGWSLNNSDKHILEALCRGNVEKVAVSVRTANTSKPKLEEKCDRIRRKIKSASNENAMQVVFFDADSQGCWLNC